MNIRVHTSFQIMLFSRHMSRHGIAGSYGRSMFSFFSSIQSSPSIMSNSLWHHGQQHSRLPVHHQLLELTQIHVHHAADTIQPTHPPSSPSPPTFNFSQHQGLFQWVSSLHQMAKVLSFSFSISPSNEHPGLISFRMDWLDLLAVQGTLKGLLQQHSSKASFLWCSAFFIVQLSHPYITTGKKPYLWLEDLCW